MGGCGHSLSLVLQELSSAVEATWLTHSPEECPGLQWDLFPNEYSDAKASYQYWLICCYVLTVESSRVYGRGTTS